MLKARKKITKKEIKEDPLVTAYVRSQKFMQQHSKKINIALAAVILISVFLMYDARSRKSINANAESQIVMAEQIFFSKDYDRAIDALMPISQEYRSSNAAGRAIFYIASAHYEKGEYSEAKEYFQQYLDNYGQIEYFKISSQAGIAACFDNEKKYAEAAAAYEKAGQMASGHFSQPFHLKNAARCYALANQNEKAKELYQSILEKYPDISFSDEITFHLEALQGHSL